MSTDEESGYVQLSRRYETGDLWFYHDGTEFEIRDVSPLFDLPGGVVVDRFLDELLKLSADRTWENDYDGFEIFHSKAEIAIRNVVDHTLDQVKECSDTALVAEQVGAQAESIYDTWKDMAYAWINEWMKLYNILLKNQTEDEISQISTVANAVGDNPFFSGVDYESLLQCCSEV